MLSVLVHHRLSFSRSV